MRRPQFPRNRYLGDVYKREVHDLDQEDVSEDGCRIDGVIRAGHGVLFYPDTLNEASRRGYKTCVKCLKDAPSTPDLRDESFPS